VVAAVEAEMQKTSPERRARDANELAAMLDELGDLTASEIAERAQANPDALVAALAAEHRVVSMRFGEREAWLAATDAPPYLALDDDATLERIALRLVRTRGPVSAPWLAARYGIEEGRAADVLDRLERRGLVRRGAFLAGAPDRQYVHIAVLDEIQRRQAHARRVPRPLASPERFTSFLLRRHHLHPDHRLVGPPGVLAALELLQGEDVPLRLWEQALLAGRLESYEREWIDRLGLAGEIVWTCFGASAGRVGVALRENLGWLRERAAPPADLDPRTKNVLLHLQLRGASFVRDLTRPTGLDAGQMLAALWELFWAGLAAPDTHSAILAGAAPVRTEPRGSAAGSVLGPGGPRGPRYRKGQARGILPHLPVVGRWSAFGDDDGLSPDERHEARAHLLLARYGVVARELVRAGWSGLRHALLRMELGGEVVRGYFVDGLSGEQYALRDALPDLDRAARRAEPHVLVNLADPANLWGSVFGLTRPDGTRVSAPRLPHTWLIFRDGRPLLLAERHGQDLTPLSGWEPADFAGAIRALQSLVDRPAALRPVRRLEIATWAGRPARESDARDPLAAAGVAIDGERAVYTPRMYT
jgi:ATP-dependent Lhr-like helicase